METKRDIETLLLCFVHGFKGDDDTFYGFPKHLTELVQQGLPDIKVESAVYPKYETRGNLPEAVTNFRTWLEEQVKQREPSGEDSKKEGQSKVGVILLAHSMGGLVATDAYFSILDETKEVKKDERQQTYPYVHGILAFDTPYCGLSRSMFAYGAFAQYQTVTSAYGLMSSVATLPSAIMSGAGTAQASSALESSSMMRDDKPAWKLWQKLAMSTGAAGAIAAAGAAAYSYREDIGRGLSYMNKENISKGLSHVNREDVGKGLSAVNMDNIKQALSSVNKEKIELGLAYMSRENLTYGFAWLSSHLQFVSALVRGTELQCRIDRITKMEGVGFENFYTSLGANDMWSGGYFVAERTFCAIPKEGTRAEKCYTRQVNKKAKDEVDAHVSMFNDKKNPAYEEMAEEAKKIVVRWSQVYTNGVVDHWRIGRPFDPNANLTRYTYSEKDGFREVDQSTGKGIFGAAKEKSKEATITPADPANANEKNTTEKEAETEKESTTSPTTASSKVSAAADYASSFKPKSWGLPSWSWSQKKTADGKTEETAATRITKYVFSDKGGLAETTKDGKKRVVISDDAKAAPLQDDAAADGASPAKSGDGTVGEEKQAVGGAEEGGEAKPDVKVEDVDGDGDDGETDVAEVSLEEVPGVTRDLEFDASRPGTAQGQQATVQDAERELQEREKGEEKDDK